MADFGNLYTQNSDSDGAHTMVSPMTFGTPTSAPPPPPPPMNSSAPPPPGNPPVDKGASTQGETKARSLSTLNRFSKGQNLLQYAIWAHYMSYGCAIFCFWLGLFAYLWTDAGPYNCKIDGKSIDAKYIKDANTGECNNIVTIEATGESRALCCQPDADIVIYGNHLVGIIYMSYAGFLLLVENVPYCFGLWYPSDSCCYRYKISPCSFVNVIMGGFGFVQPATSLAGAMLLCLGVVQFYAVRRGETGDGGRAQAKKNAKKTSCGDSCKDIQDKWKEILTWRPWTFYRRIVNEDKLSTYVWVFLYFAVNAAIFTRANIYWKTLIQNMVNGLYDGTIDLECATLLCHVNRKAVQYGPPSWFAPWAKSFGGCLNFNGAILLFPINKFLLLKLSNLGTSFNTKQKNSDTFAKFFAQPFTRYIPLSKNIEFHKMVAGVIMVFAIGHMVMHYFNLITGDVATIRLFRAFRWDYAPFFTGTVVMFAGFIIFSAALDVVRLAKYEIFFGAHHMFILFYLALFLHGPVFFYWSCIPVCLYLLERYLKTRRGRVDFLLCKVEWIPPVMAVYFRPAFKEQFVFKEGQYLHLNCPFVSKSEWHPFTISSAFDDLNLGPRIDLSTGEEVLEVPRPARLSTVATKPKRWNKYCRLSENWRDMDEDDMLERSDTGYLDYVSVHIKVHGLDEPKAKSWTRKFKEYVEMLAGRQKFPFYFYRRDNRGDISIGLLNGPDGQPVIRVDGPHSAPSEHYSSYNTCMVIGAGIGLTPCASILTALTKYRWKKGFGPEILHFYWVVRHGEIESFQWLVHMLTELSFEVKRSRYTKQIEDHNYLEINIYVTAAPKEAKEAILNRAPRDLGHEAELVGLDIKPSFTADQLYKAMLNPKASSKTQSATMRDPGAANRLQDIWIWNGRPNWDDVFASMKDQRQHKDIGVCFCGAPVIGADLRNMCEKYSDVKNECTFSLHKENF